jgi:WD40 repeat protein/serine/threonine protein kinase
LYHPDDDSLRAFSLGQITEAELAGVSAHLGECPACCRRIDQLATGDWLLARLQETEASGADERVTRAQRRLAVRALRQSRNSTSAAPANDADTQPLSRPAPRQVGDYDILAEVGRGGMGVVYKARHRGLNRLAALKMVLAGEFASHTQELRFRLEAELAARMQHPNIVQVYEIGSYEGRPFLAMEWFEGGSLANRLDGRPWSPRDAAALLETLARAIDIAHGEGVVHRDLKPANILLRRKSEPRKPKSETELDDQDLVSGSTNSPRGLASDFALPIADFEAKLTDFGLARTIEGGETMTQSGFLVGTPGYMAPEQAGGKRALVGPGTDIYALGVVLYQLLTGHLPFQRESTLELLRAVTSDEPTPPRRLQPSVPRDLEAITLHCLEKEPSARYPSALALAEDLRRFQEGKQVVARPVGAAARLVRACRRRPVIATLLVLLALSLIGGTSGITWKWLEANDQRDLANANAGQANKEKQAALYQAYRASLAAGNASLQTHEVADAARLLDLAPEALRGWEWRHLHSRLDDSSAVVSSPASTGAFLIPGPDQLRLGFSTTDRLSIMDLDGAEQKTVALGPQRPRGVSVAHTQRGLRIAVWVEDTGFDLLDETGLVLCHATLTPDKITKIAGVVMSPDGRRLACSREEHAEFQVFDATSGKQTAICSNQGTGVKTFSPDSSRIATFNADSACVWDAATGTRVAICRGHAGDIHSVDFSPDGARLVTASTDGTVRQWDARTGQEVERPYDRHGALVNWAVYSPDGEWIASAGNDRTIRVWRARGQRDVAVLLGHTGQVIELAFAPDGRRLVSRGSRMDSTGWDGSDWIWDVDPRATLPVLRSHTSFVYPVAFSPDGRWLASGSWDKTVRVWDAATGELCATLAHPNFVQGLAFGPDGTWLVTICHQNDRLRVWDVATARVRKEIPFSTDYDAALTVSPDGTRVATRDFSWDTSKWRLAVFDIGSGKLLFTTDGSALAYSPDGRWLAATDGDAKTLLLLDARTHETIARFRGHENTVFKAVFSADSSCLASCSQDLTIRLWQIGSGACRVLRGHFDVVYGVAFHPDGTRLASGSRDGVICVWDVARGDQLLRLRGHDDYVWSLAFSPDGSTLASGSGDGTVRLWDTAPVKKRYQARREAAALQPKAERLVEQLWREKNAPANVAEAIRLDRTLSEEQRHAALRAVLRRSHAPEAGRDSPQTAAK